MTRPAVVSVNLGRPREVPWRGRSVRTSFFKTPCSGSVAVGPEGLASDEVGDPRVHGGPRKAVYSYPSEHYAPWQAELGVERLPWGSFGENLSLHGLLERDVCPGDQLEVGSAVFEVTQPRTPCFKLNVRFGREDMVRRFARADRSGFYLRVVRAGRLTAGDVIRHVAGPTRGPTIEAVYRSAMQRAIDPVEEFEDV